MAFLDTIFGRIAILVVCVALAFGSGFLYGHNKGWDSATAHYTAVVNAAMAANATDAATIASLKQANEQFTQDAEQNASKLAQAQSQMAEQAKTSAARLGAVQRRLLEVERENEANRIWGAGIAPSRVTGILRQ